MEFELEALLRERGAELARTAEERERALRLPNFAVVRVREQLFGVPLHCFTGAARVPITPVPLSRPWIAGVTYYQGGFWPVAWLDSQRGPTPAEGLVLFLRDRPLALLVDESLRLAFRATEERASLQSFGDVPGVLQSGMDDEGILHLEFSER